MPLKNAKLYDLAQPLGPGSTYVWPYFEDVEWRRVGYFGLHGLNTMEVNKLTFHTSTHTDAPFHNLEDGRSVEKIPLDRYFGEAVVLDIPKEEFGRITAEDLKKARPQIKRNDIVVIVTGWYKKFPLEQTFMVKHPGLVPDAADWLVKKKVKGVAVDFGSVDHPMQTALAEIRKDLMPEKPDAAGEYRKKWPMLYVHRTFARNNITIVEYIGGQVGQLLGKRIMFAAFPLKIVNGDASLVRPVGIVER
jgi:kynurenine formamidase